MTGDDATADGDEATTNDRVAVTDGRATSDDGDAARDEGVTLRDEDLHRPDELDGETVACTLTGDEAEKRAAWIRSELVPHLEAIERREGGASGDGDSGDSDDGEVASGDGETAVDSAASSADGSDDDEEAKGGYTLVFAEEALEAVMRFARHEHWCCSFAHFEVHVTPGEEPNELSVYGPEGTEEVFGEEFVSAMAGEAGVSVPG